MVRGAQLSAFTARTLPPTPMVPDASQIAARCVAQSRQRFSARRTDVERFIAKSLSAP
jgi:hypothetical protein